MRGRVVRACSTGALLALSGFTAFAQDAAPATSPVATTLTVLDERPDADKTQKNLSLMITSCSYGVLRLSDKNMPDRFDSLRTDLAELKGAGLEGKTLHVPRFDIYVNNSVWLRKSVGAQFSGALVDMIMEHGVNCPREKMKGGWFAASEISTVHPPLVVEIEATLDGVAYTARAAHSPAVPQGGKFKKPEDLQELDAALRKAAEVLAAQLP